MRPVLRLWGAIKREMGAAKWTIGAIGFQTGLAYVVSLILYQLGLVILAGEGMTFWTGVAVGLLLLILYFIFRKPRQQVEEIIHLDRLAMVGK